MTRRHLTTVFGVSCFLMLGACNTKQPKVQPAAKAASATLATTAATVPQVADEAPDLASEAEFAADPHKHMKAHFVRALRLQDAVLAGDLPKAKVEARWLAGHDKEDVPVTWLESLKPFQAAAKAVANAATVDDAAIAVAQMSAACGNCHVANHATPKIGSAPVIKGASNVKSHMAAQIGALDKLWNGLVIPSDEAWQDGAELLEKVVITAKALDEGGLGQAESAKVLAETLHSLSATAGKVAKADRPTAYADLLTTCVACHAAVRKPPVAERP